MGKTVKKTTKLTVATSNEIARTKQDETARKKRQPSFHEMEMISNKSMEQMNSPDLTTRHASDFLNIAEYKPPYKQRRFNLKNTEVYITNIESSCTTIKHNKEKNNKHVNIEDDESSSDLDASSFPDEFEDIEFNFLKHDIYKIAQKSEHDFYLTVHRDGVVYMHGFISINVLQGSVEILGYNVDASNKFFNIYSPAGSALLSICNNTSNDAILFCEKLDTPLSRSLNLYAPKNILPSLQENGSQCIINCADVFAKFSLFEPPPNWGEFSKTLTSKSRVIIAGNKGSGKSTLLRYLVNKLLSNNGVKKGFTQVLVVDLDPGQPEFTIPGCISINLVDSPLLGPSYTHQKSPEICVHISNIDIKYNMDEYIRSCKYLLNLIEDYPNIPAIVNYIGYTRGLGQELISTIISFVNPTNIVQINDPKGNYNFQKDLTIENVENDAKFIPGITEDINLNFDLIKFDGLHKKLNGTTYTAGQLRDIAIVSYFSNILKGDPLCLTDPGITMFSAPLDKIKIEDSLGNSHPAICNANLVSLCQKVSFEDSFVLHCLGWGVVRCVSIPRNIIYLLTPLQIELLEQTKSIVVNCIRLPLAMYITTAKDVSGQIPYVEDGQQTDLEKPSKRQHYNKDKANQ